MPGDALTAIVARNQYYRIAQRRILIVFLISLLNNILLTGVFIYLWMHPPAPVYFPINLGGYIIPIVPLDKPNQTDQSVVDWTTKAVLASYAYSFVNYREEIQAASGFFTPRGWNSFLNALQKSNNLDAVTARKMVVSATLNGKPILEKKGVLGSALAWGITVPIIATFQNTREFTQQYLNIYVVVVRVPILNAPSGVGIEQMVVKPIPVNS